MIKNVTPSTAKNERTTTPAPFFAVPVLGDTLLAVVLTPAVTAIFDLMLAVVGWLTTTGALVTVTVCTLDAPDVPGTTLVAM